MENTENLVLPYVMPSQLQPHVTHNEALRALDALVHLAVADKDISGPPSSPAPGARYIVGPGPTEEWSGHAGDVAAWQDGAWAFYRPATGWFAWVHDESRLYLFSAGAWAQAPGGGGAGIVPKGAWSDAGTYALGDLVEHGGHAFLSNVDDNADNEPDAATPGSTAEWTYFAIFAGGGGGEVDINPAPLVGVNAVADATDRLSVSSPATLFSHEGDDHRLKINKAAAGDTASVLFQTGFSGRAEFGLAGDDDWHVKVSADGETWQEAIVVDCATGAVSLPNTPSGGGGGDAPLRGHLYGLALANNSSDAAHDVDIAEGEAASDAATPALMRLSSATTKRFDATFAEGSGNGGMVSGESLPTSGTIHLWLIAKGDGTTDVCASDHASSGLSPTLPAGFTHKRRIGSLVTDASANIRALSIQDGDIFLHDAPLLDWEQGTPANSTNTNRSISVPAGILVTAILNVGLVHTSNSPNTNIAALVYSNLGSARSLSASGYDSWRHATVIRMSGVGGGHKAEIRVPTNAAQVREYVVNTNASTTVYGVTLGWIDARGRF